MYNAVQETPVVFLTDLSSPSIKNYKMFSTPLGITGAMLQASIDAVPFTFCG
jgi:hypothetical protein